MALSCDPQLLIVSTDAVIVYTLDLAKLKPEAVLELLTDAPALVGYDVKYTLKILMQLGSKKLPMVGHDVLIGAFLLNSLRREQTLTELAEAELDYEGSPFEDLDKDEIVTRAAEIIAVIKALHDKQIKDIKAVPKLPELARDIEWPVIPVLADMERAGIKMDVSYMRQFATEIDDMVSDYEQQIYGHADQEFNIGSPSQLAEILFVKLGLHTQGIKKGKTGFSTDARQLDKLRGSHPIIDLISQYREVAKLKNTYVDVLPELVDEDSRIHTTYNLTIAQTGRLSSTDPNLQNIPTRTDLSRRIRTAFVADKGHKLISADYSQIELRLAAVLSKDPEWIEMFNRGADVHAATAAQVYGREQEDVTKQMRRAAKAINFGILYGLSPHGLSVGTGMTREQAVTFIDKYKELRKPLFDYMDQVKEQAQKDGFVATLFGRRRPMPDIHSSNFIVRQAAERAAVNMPIQGTAADLMKIAMIDVYKVLEEQHNNCRLLLQVHDSILVECPAEVAERTAELIKQSMESVYELPVRLDVDVTIGDNWGEL